MNLFIDTHLEDIVFILSKENEIIKKKVINGKNHSTIIMPALRDFLDDLVPESIIVVNGPGFFTSVRLGVTIAKTLAFTLNIPIRVISSLECLAVSCDALEKIVAISDNNGYYVGIFDNDIKLVGDYVYLSNSEFATYEKEYKVYTNMPLNYENIINYGLSKKPINPHKVNPIYIKKLDVEKW